MEVYYTRCLIEGHPCLAFDYGSDNNVVSKDWWRNSSYQQPLIRIKHRSNSEHDNLIPWTLVLFERSIMWYCSHGLLSSSFGTGLASF